MAKGDKSRAASATAALACLLGSHGLNARGRRGGIGDGGSDDDVRNVVRLVVEGDRGRLVLMLVVTRQGSLGQTGGLDQLVARHQEPDARQGAPGQLELGFEI